jgi:hypothetical protein
MPEWKPERGRRSWWWAPGSPDPPSLKARDWEATAVPELRQLAARLAAKLANP